jgi:vancomycin permeability regulator SanA
MRDGGAITERPDDVDPTVEMHRDDMPRTRTDLPRRQADPTREDLPRRSRAGSGDEPIVPYDDGSGGSYDVAPRTRTPWRWVKRTFYLLVALLIGTPLAAGFYVWYVAREDVRTHSDAILVLGAAQFNGTPGDVLAWRLQHALTLFRDGVAKHIVTVGGNQPGDKYTEAGSGVAWLSQHGVPANDLVGVRTGNDTLQSMVAAGKEFRKRGWHTAVIVTDPPHSLRSRTMARANGIDAVTSPTRSGPTVYSRDTQLHYIVRETGGYLYFQLIGRWRDEP